MCLAGNISISFTPMPENREGGTQEKEESGETPKQKLLRLAEELDYDDRCGGEAVKAYREQLRELASHVDMLEGLGFTIHIECTAPQRDNICKVSLERQGETLDIYEEFFDTHSRGFGGTPFGESVHTIRKRVSDVQTLARMFSKG